MLLFGLTQLQIVLVFGFFLKFLVVVVGFSSVPPTTYSDINGSAFISWLRRSTGWKDIREKKSKTNNKIQQPRLAFPLIALPFTAPL